MGVTYIEGQVKGPSGKQENVKFLVDSGATYSLLPKTAWEAIGLKPKRKFKNGGIVKVCVSRKKSSKKSISLLVMRLILVSNTVKL